MKVVRNGVVKMDWNADGFIETKSRGFISAVHQYNGVAVAFRDGKIYNHVDDDGNALGFEDLVSTIKTATKNKDADYPFFYEDYAEIYDGMDFSEGTVRLLNLEEYKDDMLARLDDLRPYWDLEEVEMP